MNRTASCTASNKPDPAARWHELKTHREPFFAVERYQKRFEIRSEQDRTFAVGDYLHLREWDEEEGVYTARTINVLVTYIVRGPSWGIPEGMVVMSIARSSDDVPSYAKFQQPKVSP